MRCVLRATELERAPSVPELVSRLRARRGLAVLDSAGGEPRRWSLVAFDPLRGLELPHDLGGLRAFARALAILGIREAALRDGESDVPGPFHGGFVGAL